MQDTTVLSGVAANAAHYEEVLSLDGAPEKRFAGRLAISADASSVIEATSDCASDVGRFSYRYTSSETDYVFFDEGDGSVWFYKYE